MTQTDALRRHKTYMHESFHIAHNRGFLSLSHSQSHFFLSPLLFLFPLVCFHVSKGDMTSSFRPLPKVSQFRFYHSPSVSQPTSQSVIPHSSCRNVKEESRPGLVLLSSVISFAMRSYCGRECGKINTSVTEW